MRIVVLSFALLVAACLDTPVDSTGVPTTGKAPATNAVTGVTMRYVAVDLVVGETIQLGFVPHLTNSGAFIPLELRWRSSVPEVATVDANAIVTAVGPGQSHVTVTVDGYSGQTTVTVHAAPSPGR